MSNEQAYEQLRVRKNQLEQRLHDLQEKEQCIREGICQKYGHFFSPINFVYLYDSDRSTPWLCFLGSRHAMYEVTKRCICCGFLSQDVERLPVKYVQNAKEAHLYDNVQQELNEALNQITSQREMFASELNAIKTQLCALSW